MRYPAVRTAQALIPLRGFSVTPAGAAAAVVGMAAAYVLEQGQDALHSLQVQAGASNPNGLPTPPGWSGPNSPPTTETPGYYWKRYSVVENLGPTAEGAATALCNGGTHNGSYTSATEYTFTCTSGPYNGASNTVARATGCPSGYTASGSSCLLTDSPPVKWPSDDIYTVQQVGANFTSHPRDPDTLSMSSTSSLTFNGVDAANHPTKTTITGNADGSQTIRTQTQYENPLGQTSVNDYLVTINNAGNVTNITNYDTYNTSLSTYNGASPAAPSSAQTINLPTDYNREATQQQIKTGIDTLHNDVVDVEAGVDIVDDTLHEVKESVDYLGGEKKEEIKVDPNVDTGFDDFKETVDAVATAETPGWMEWIIPDQLFPEGGSCGELGYTFHGVSVDYSPLCPQMEVGRAIIGWLLALWTVIGLYGLAMEAVRK